MSLADVVVIVLAFVVMLIRASFCIYNASIKHELDKRRKSRLGNSGVDGDECDR